MSKITYTSPVFRNEDGAPRTFIIPADALTTYAKRDAALLKLMELGGIHAEPTPEFVKIRSKMMSAKRKIQRMGWFSIIPA
jgi:hypothetical protein